MASIRAGFLAVLLLIFLSPIALAQMELKDYNEQLKINPVFRSYINGVGRGIAWANVVVKNQKNAPLFCGGPPKLALGPENYISILDAAIKARTNDVKPDAPIELLLLRGLQESFPCEQLKP
jgi:hypothetical protein